MKFIFVSFVMIMLAGCAMNPRTAVTPASLEGGYVVYFEQIDRIPKDVLLTVYGNGELKAGASGSISPEMIGKIIEEILDIIPELSDNYNSERVDNALICRRILFRGYETPEQLEKINEIIKSVGNSIKYLTPDTKESYEVGRSK